MTVAPLVWTAALLGLMGVCAEGVRRLPPRVGVAFAVAIPVVGTPVWLALAGAPLFSVVKVYSVCAALLLLELLRATRWVERPWGRWLAVGLLALNILEAVVADAAAGAWLNAAAGTLLVVTLAGPSAVSVDRASRWGDLRYALGGWWVAAYSAWNFAFVYGNRPGFAAFGLVHVVAPLLACRGDWALWIQARVAVLTLMMVLRMSAPEPPFVYLVPQWQVPVVGQALHVAAFALAAFVLARWVRARIR